MSDTSIDFIASMHPLSRGLAGLTLLLTAALNGSLHVALIQLFITVSLLLMLASGTKALWESIRLLGWLIIPILLLHALFTPGKLLLKGADVPISVEGLQLGGWLALHLACIYLSALVFSRLLAKSEWIGLMLLLPRWGERLIPYVLLLESGLDKNRKIVRCEYDRWSAGGKKIRELPVHIISTLTNVMNENGKSAAELWNEWDMRMLAVKDESCSSAPFNLAATTVAAMTTSIIWTIFLAGGI